MGYAVDDMGGDRNTSLWHQFITHTQFTVLYTCVYQSINPLYSGIFYPYTNYVISDSYAIKI